MNNTIKIDTEKLKEVYAFTSIENLLYTMKNEIWELSHHNKNYTQKQYHKILALEEIINCMSVEEE